MKFLVLQHVPHEHPGLIAEYAKQHDIQLVVTKGWEPQAIPSVTDFDALVIMGGPMGVYEDFPSKEDELATIRMALEKNIPIVGFCLGSQLLAHALGCKVYPNIKDGQKIKEIGYYDITLTSEGAKDPIFNGFTSPVSVLEWHGDAFDLPTEAVLLATSSACVNQAFRYGKNAYGMLFHNEFTPQMVEDMMTIDAKWIHDQFDIDESKLRMQALEKKDLMRRQCYQLMDNFVQYFVVK